jgi:hypothetical protein
MDHAVKSGRIYIAEDVGLIDPAHSSEIRDDAARLSRQIAALIEKAKRTR